MDIFKSLTVGVKFKKRRWDQNLATKLNTSENKDDKINVTQKPKKKIKKLSDEHQKQKQSEKVNFVRKLHNINVKGDVEKEKPIESFEELFLRFSIAESLKNNVLSLRYENLTPVQMQVIPLFLKRKQLKVCANTGSGKYCSCKNILHRHLLILNFCHELFLIYFIGKTFAFLFPLIQILMDNNDESSNKMPFIDNIRAIILIPTRELAQQILSVATRLCYETNIRANLITSTNKVHMKNFHKKKTNILITTPLRLVHFIKSSTMSLSSVEWIIIDEVDKFFEESNQTFQQDLDVILKTCDNPNRKFALFSATTTKEMTKWVHEKLIDGFVTINISPNKPVCSVNQELRYVGTDSAKLMELREIFRQGIQPPILIFVQTKNRAKQLFTELMYDGLNIDIIHSERSGKDRNEIYKKFREGKIWILICTELMSRGIDFRNVSLVVNFDLPTSLISYIHKVGRVGRTGSANQNDMAITFYTNDDNKCGLLRDIAKIMKASGSSVEPFLLQLKKSTKTERDKLLKKAPKRKSISTKIDFHKTRRVMKRKKE